MTIQGVLKGDIHYWENTRGCILVSFEATKSLTSHDNIDQAINYLAANGHVEAARELHNKHN